MISLEQIRLLENKVQKAVSLITGLQDENATLKQKQSEYESRIRELESLIEDFRNEQSEIEQGIVSALNRLEDLEAAAQELHPKKESAPKAEAVSNKTESVPPAQQGTVPPAQAASKPVTQTAGQPAVSPAEKPEELPAEEPPVSLDDDEIEFQDMTEKEDKQEDELELF